MKFTPICFFLLLLSVFSCKQENKHLTRIEGKLLPITDSLKSHTEIEGIITPYRNHINKDLDSVIAYAVDTYSKSDGELNTAIGNLFADAIYEQANPVFKQRTAKNIDLVLVNHGGIRAIISKGNVTKRTAFNIMPFENSIVVVALSGKNVKQLINYLTKAKRAHPITGLKLTVDADYNLKEALINGKPIDTLQTYYVATNDYLYNGGDHMTFFKPNDSLYVLDYKIRNALLDYFYKKDTINPTIDDRFIKLDN
ncbi:5'-nucleotidase C-terminal domain-containing protein [Mangrovimonas cancribranchiae]|uniref:5'-nucleotidase C-terminal domain-containing protein n=1 Tax=Mangrovimonas cancribranchiae TaxID=3080055 RepID=A0AAU6P388_9FLAO